MNDRTESIYPAAPVLRVLVSIAAAAGLEIMQVYRGLFATQHKADGSPVTEADMRADRVIRAGLAEHFPGVFVWSEESQSEMPKQPPRRFFLVDPLDGTKEFIARNGEFTVNITLIEDGAPVAAVVLAPALEEVYCAAVGYGAWGWRSDAATEVAISWPPVGAERLRTVGRYGGSVIRVLGSRSHRGDDAPLQAWLAEQEREGRQCLVTPCGSSLKFCRIAQGAADAYPRFGPTSQWDTAAGHCVLEVAGGQVRDLRGKPLNYGTDRPVLNPDFIATGAPCIAPPT